MLEGEGKRGETQRTRRKVRGGHTGEMGGLEKADRLTPAVNRTGRGGEGGRQVNSPAVPPLPCFPSSLPHFLLEPTGRGASEAYSSSSFSPSLSGRGAAGLEGEGERAKACYCQ